MEVMTKHGALRGVREGRLCCFKGIPYAKAERFCPPEECRWEGTLDCAAFGKKAIQVWDTDRPYMPKQDPSEFSEDCLFLNIYTPSLEGCLPVVIYIHGGAFQDGSGQDRIGADIIREHDFIYVSFNYRLGVLGYLYLGRLLGERYQHTGNLGTLDQLAAVRWVYENIGAFGGDPERITVMGESAGAKSISALLVRPEMKTYCKQVCLSSGAYQCIRDEETADKLAHRFLNHAGLERAEDLLTMPVDELVAAQKKLCAEPGSTCFFGPVADGKVIPYDWQSRLDWGGSAIVGSCRNEVAFYKLFDPDFLEHAPGIADTLFGVNAEIAKRDFAGLVKPDFGEDARSGLWVKILTDYMYRTYSARMARRLVKNGGRVWYYSTEFSKATHCLDQWLAFDGHGLPDEPDGPVKDAAPRLGRAIYESYARFFLSGDPNGEGIPAWPKLSEGDARRMIWDVEPRVEAVPEDDVLDHFPEYVFKL